MYKRMFAATAVLATLAAATMALPAQARSSVDVQIGVPAPGYVAPPPPARYEVVPVARAGHVWVPGHWQWNGNGHVWVQGHFLRARPGYYYEPATWVQHGDRWGYREGHWGRRDRDHDGVPNRFDHDR